MVSNQKSCAIKWAIQFRESWTPSRRVKISRIFSAIPPNPSEREFEGGTDSTVVSIHRHFSYDIASVRRIPGPVFYRGPNISNDEASEPDDVRDRHYIRCGADDYENENDDFNVEPEDLAELEDSTQTTTTPTMTIGGQMSARTRRRMPITELESKPLEIGATKIGTEIVC